MERKIYRPNGLAVYCDFRSGRVQVHDHAAGKRLAVVKVEAEEFDLDLSWDSQTLFTSDWQQSQLNLWRVDDGGHLEMTELPRRIGQMKVDRSGHRIAYLAPKGFYAVDLTTRQEIKMQNCEENLKYSSSFSPLHNHLLVPMRRKGKVTEVRFDHLDAQVRELPIDVTVRWLEHHPSQQSYTIIDTKKCVYSLGAEDHKLLWKTSLKKIAGGDHIGVGGHSGDGQWIGIVIARRASTDVVVLQAESGEVLHQFQRCGSCSGFPYYGSLVLSKYVHNGERVTTGEVFDLATGGRNTVTLNAAK